MCLSHICFNSGLLELDCPMMSSIASFSHWQSSGFAGLLASMNSVKGRHLYFVSSSTSKKTRRPGNDFSRLGFAPGVGHAAATQLTTFRFCDGGGGCDGMVVSLDSRGSICV